MMPGAAEYRTEHVAETPRGWHVRMKAPGPQSQHLIGIAFPPGRRKKGSGKLIEILHPAGERNPRCEISKKARENPGELLIFGNPHERRVSRTAGGKRPGHQPGCGCFACRHARGETVARHSAKNNSKLAQQREARERSARIRAARQMRGPRFRDVGRGNPWQGAGNFPTKEEALKLKRQLEATGKRAQIVVSAKGTKAENYGVVVMNPFAGWKHFTKGEKQFLSQRLHVPAPQNMEDVAAYKQTLRRIDEINAKYRRGEFSRDKAVDEQHSAVRSIGAKINPAQLRRAFDPGRCCGPRRRNPSDIDQAVNLYQSFHGRDPKSIVEEHVSAATRLDYTALGDLEYLEVKTPLGQKAKFEFPNDGVKLASSPDGKQLYCIGGNQNLLPCLDKDSQQKDFIDLGDGLEVQYLARKVHADFRPVSYFHKFGELNGARPRLMFDKLKKQIFFVGGEYFIDTSKGVSDGIEN